VNESSQNHIMVVQKWFHWKVRMLISFHFIYLFVQGPDTLINPWVNVLTLAKAKFQLWSLWPDVTAFTKGVRG